MIARLLARVGLVTPEQRAWAWYDWANSVYFTTVITAVFPSFYSTYAAKGLEPAQASARFAFITTVSVLIIALLAPILGALADYSGMKKRLLGIFMTIGVTSCALMVLIGEGDIMLASVLFFVGNIGVSGSTVFYDSLLPHVARPEETDRVSSAGYAIGYLGGGVLLAINLLMIQQPGWFGLPADGTAVRLSLASVGIWWLLFSIPLFRVVPEPAKRLETDEQPGGNAFATGVRRLIETLKELRRYKQAFLLLLAFLVYNDGIQTIIRMATIYGASLKLDESAMITALLITQFTGVPFAFLFGHAAGIIGPKRAVFVGLGVYALITLLGYYMQTATHFFMLAILVGMVQGGTQALSRSMFASMIPRHKSSEFFAFFGVFERYAGILGPLVFASMVDATGSSRNAILAVLGFFIVGGGLLLFVDVEGGRRAARAAEAALVRS